MKPQLQFQAKFRTVPTFNSSELTRPKVPTFDPSELLIPPPPAHGFKFRPEPAPQPAPAPARPTHPRSAYAILAALSARLYKLDTEQTRGDVAAIMLLFFGEELPRRNVRAFSNYALNVKGHRFNYTSRLFGGLCDLLCEDHIDDAHALCQTHLAAFEEAERKASQFGVPNDLDRRLSALLGRTGGQDE